MGSLPCYGRLRYAAITLREDNTSHAKDPVVRKYTVLQVGLGVVSIFKVMEAIETAAQGVGTPAAEEEVVYACFISVSLFLETSQLVVLSPNNPTITKRQAV